jgi:hypothetical protein
MELIGVGIQQANGNYIYPYSASVNGSSNELPRRKRRRIRTEGIQTSVMCLSYYKDLYPSLLDSNVLTMPLPGTSAQ